MSQFGWSHYRGVVDIEGNTNAWGLFWRLGSGSVVFRVPGDFTNSYIRQLVPGVHFLPLAADLSDLANVTARIRDSSLARIPVNARSLLRNFTYQLEVDRVARELSDLWSR